MKRAADPQRCQINPQIGGVLIRGERGTAKSTAARALAALLPTIEVVQGCRFNCDPTAARSLLRRVPRPLRSDGRCPLHMRRTPFVDLPVSATEDRVVGTLDIEKAIQKGERHFEPGVLAAANRGVLYVDEVNLLDDHVVDLLLDSAAMGVNVVEREGISFQHPARFVLVGSMNPEEGDLRPQLLDRFAHAVDVVGITEATQRVEVLRGASSSSRTRTTSRTPPTKRRKRCATASSRRGNATRWSSTPSKDMYTIAVSRRASRWTVTAPTS
jgi:Mg-chelatase subunit ChlI